MMIWKDGSLILVRRVLAYKVRESKPVSNGVPPAKSRMLSPRTPDAARFLFASVALAGRTQCEVDDVTGRLIDSY